MDQSINYPPILAEIQVNIPIGKEEKTWTNITKKGFLRV
jgi:hypothetical protein